MKQLITILLAVFTAQSLGATYKWVDEEGSVHYSDQPTDNYKTNEVAIESGPSKEAVEEARELAEEQLHRSRVRSLPLAELGPLPENESSEYVETMGTGITLNAQELVGSFYILLKAKNALPPEAYLEVHFPNPTNLINPLVVGKVREGGTPKVLIKSPELTGLKCWNYEIVTYIYQDSTKSKLLGTHIQFMQSRVNMDKARDAMELATAMLKGNCP